MIRYWICALLLLSACGNANGAAPTIARAFTPLHTITPSRAAATRLAPSPHSTATRTPAPPRSTLPATSTQRAPTGTSESRTNTSVPNDALERVRALLYEQLNAARVKQGANPLRADPLLETIARTRSADMIARNYFSHQDPTTGQALITPLLEQYYVRPKRWGENIAESLGRGTNDANALANDFAERWLASPGHAKNILDPSFSRTGIGLAVSPDEKRVVVTQVFAD